MACDTTNLSVIGYADGFTMWLYKTTAPSDVVREPGYFDLAARTMRMRRGDLLVIHSGVESVQRHTMAFVTTIEPLTLTVLGAD